nr:immunoglobulin heavy chain junction region [Macaca mulatta]MOV89231.1 immunoglobulin heavy chain junction region [Macaca mulatta]MOV90140.1 immunoglobulin heavy chain junction region [Macaca mulatta]MOV91312.1 immunoglobulin heavy chain junction region [Macaca mulatta]MOV91469.1 immunoglobulin heavy chain junction region [Macaca mulatta]
CAEGTYSLDVW